MNRISKNGISKLHEKVISFDKSLSLLVAQSAKPHGLLGAMDFFIPSHSLDWFKKNMKAILVQSNQSASETILLKAQLKKNRAIITLKDIVDRNQSEALKGASLYIQISSLESPKGELPFLNELMGFMVHDQKLGDLGPVTGFLSNGPQDILVVTSIQNQQELMVLFVEAFILDVDYSKKIIKMDLPEGLI